jgi:hypothetical protein
MGEGVLVFPTSNLGRTRIIDGGLQTFYLVFRIIRFAAGCFNNAIVLWVSVRNNTQ